MTYAGRLDPLATGALIILIGEECLQKKTYLGFDKEYLAQFACGIATDTGDIFGLITKVSTEVVNGKDLALSNAHLLHVEQVCRAITEQQYPLFSSKKVQGKQLFEHGLEGNTTVDRPYRAVTIHSCNLALGKQITVHDVYDHVCSAAQELGNGFRADQIVTDWSALIKDGVKGGATLPTITMNCKVSSGTYIRVFSDTLAQEFEQPWLMTSLHRERIGEYECPQAPHDTFVIR
jgi:tRNA pseudouridine(55) synthase